MGGQQASNRIVGQLCTPFACILTGTPATSSKLVSLLFWWIWMLRPSLAVKMSLLSVTASGMRPCIDFFIEKPPFSPVTNVTFQFSFV